MIKYILVFCYETPSIAKKYRNLKEADGLDQPLFSTILLIYLRNQNGMRKKPADRDRKVITTNNGY